MIDFIIAALCALLFTFVALFFVSFVTLGVITSIIHLVSVVYRHLVDGKSPAYQEQTV